MVSMRVNVLHRRTTAKHLDGTAYLLALVVCNIAQVVQEYERAVIFRLGRLLPVGAKGPGEQV